MKPLAIEATPHDIHDNTLLGRSHYQWVYRLHNDLGLSVAWGAGTYCDDRNGGPYDEAAEHTYECAVIRFGTTHAKSEEGEVIPSDDPDDWTLCYDTPVANDVLGWQSLADIAATLLKLARLPRVTQGTPAHAEVAA